MAAEPAAAKPPEGKPAATGTVAAPGQRPSRPTSSPARPRQPPRPRRRSVPQPSRPKASRSTPSRPRVRRKPRASQPCPTEPARPWRPQRSPSARQVRPRSAPRRSGWSSSSRPTAAISRPAPARSCARCCERSAQDRRYEVVLEASVSGSQKVVGAETAEDAAKYNRWLAARRLDRVREWLDQNAAGQGADDQAGVSRQQRVPPGRGAHPPDRLTVGVSRSIAPTTTPARSSRASARPADRRREPEHRANDESRRSVPHMRATG